MGRIAIAYFSGTGNTWQIARHYCAALEAREQSVELFAIERLLEQGRHTFEEYDWLGIGYPVHAWNAPLPVARFITGLAQTEAGRAFLWVTAGSSLGGALDWARAQLERRGYQVAHEAFYYTGCDYYFSARARHLAASEIERCFNWCDRDVQEAVGEILSGGERHQYAGSAARFWLSNLGWRFYRLGCRHAYRYFRADERCDGCGLCVRTCPTHNIQLDKGRIIFGPHGTLCLRCLSICPKQAIQVARLTQQLGRYLAPGYARYLSDETL